MKKMILSAGKLLHKEGLRTVAIGCIFVFALFPLLTLALHITRDDWQYVLEDAAFGRAIWNSVVYTGISAVITTLLALLAAYLLNASSSKHKNVFVLLLTLGMLVPTVSVGLGLRILFGTRGFLDLLLGLRIEVRGFPGLILGSVITAFPATFLILYDALHYEDKGPYDAASIMGISRLSTFFRLTLPYLRTALISSFFACFTLIFADYGIPMEIAGRVKTLPMYLYEQFMSSFQYGRGSIAGFILLVPAAASFVFDLIFRDQSVNEKQQRLIQPAKRFNRIVACILTLLCLLLFMPQLSFISMSFTTAFPNDLTFTLSHITSIFSNTYGVGLTDYILNSLVLSLCTAVVGVCFAYLLGYLSVRKEGKAGKVVDVLALSTIAIPGLVLGIGYIFLFSGTNGVFYGTMLILVVVNVFHFLGSPYLLAKNCLSKINREYEVIGETLGISKGKIIARVLLPGSVSTLIEMFSYFFLNSMITISAVAFLCSYSNQPLSILITNYEKNSNYEMQSVISFLILSINVVFQVVFSLISQGMKRAKNREKEGGIRLTRYQFDLLTYLEKHGRQRYTKRSLADALTLSLSMLERQLSELEALDYINILADGQMHISDKGLRALEPYRVRRAVILAAGFGSRLAPVTLATPKPLVKVQGVRIIDTLLDALAAKGITNVTIVRGYKKEQFDVLLEKYPYLRFVDNQQYNVTNNISSAVLVAEQLDHCYLCEADLLISNPDIINKYEYDTNYLGAKVAETDDWCFMNRHGMVDRYQMGGTDCYQAYGISYWDSRDADKLHADLLKVYRSRAGKEHLWENVPLQFCKQNYKVAVRECRKEDIIEIDNYAELLAVDDSYTNFPGYEEYMVR